MRVIGVVISGVLAGWLLASAPLAAADLSAREQVELTVYNQDFALVREHRTLELQKGLNRLSLEDVAALLDPTSVHVKSLTAPDQVRVAEQNYEFDLVNYGKLLQRYIGKEIEIHEVADQKTGEIRVKRAKLLSSGYIPQPQQIGYGLQTAYQYTSYSQPLFEIDGKIYSNATGTVVLPALPEGLILKPTLSWELECARPGRHQVELSYMTLGIKWVADYVAVVNANDTQLDLTGWVTLDNRSGVAYQDAKLKLMAGDVHVVQPAALAGAMHVQSALQEADRALMPQFQEKSFFEYHLYTLQRPTTIKENEIKQVEFASAGTIPVTKRYIYDGFQTNPRYQGWDVYSFREQLDYGQVGQKKVGVFLEFKNSQENHLGIPLPKGRIRLYKEATDKGQEFVGEDLIDHTPKDEAVSLYAGNAFDLVGERRQTDFRVIEPGHVVEESFDISLRNHKAEDVVITVREHLYRGQEWDIRSTTHPFEKKDVQTIEVTVPVAKDGEAKLTYTVRYRW